MANKNTYRVKFRRRRELKTDYNKRLDLVKSGLPRLVVRKNNKGNVVAQVIRFKIDGDVVLAQATATQLVKEYGWKGGCGNLPAAYLIGLLIGKKTKEKVEGVDEVILDIGRQHPVHGGKLFATLKGAVDGGLNVLGSKEAYPTDTRVRGEHIASYYSGLSEDDRKRFFTKYDLSPEELPSHFDSVKKKILEGA